MTTSTILSIVALALLAGAAPDRRYAAINMSPAGALVPRFFIDAPQLAIRDGEHPPYVKPDNNAWCCPLGSLCDSKCSPTAYQCPTTVTLTVTRTQAGSAQAATTSLTTSVSSACCGRTCPSPSSFRCEARFGGGCCAYGETCISSSGCVRTVTQSTSASALLTAADPGCTAATQHACDDGRGGCCDDLEHCTIVSGTAACAPGNPTATDVLIMTSSGGGGLSAGAKAGIGVGVSVVGCVLVGLSAWFCLVRRRRGTTATGSQRPSRGGRAMSDVTGAGRRGATQDYFGPEAVAGPYTDTATVTSEATTPGMARGVPVQAHAPSDIAAPVEIDSRGVKRGYAHHVTAVPAGHSILGTTDGRHELYGSEMLSPPSPMPSPPLVSPGSPRSVSVLDRSPVG
ncbi:hypothetical protein CCHL11_08442 [Colletotrichum chlorophyti]|uniref:Uncharacterized protein n=1 Tax=Colletotrichum chlorophyti TaxID=708187 RepID=A0A1Q8RQA4_9PEZI|nr:hypothetical protein CCHL11_08442 [Colletotrichum chlorophyti]